ncbi:hypothetical protein OXIME_000241 [Oxyplasma meridianum]|uniref:Uncharacterized protein n=1 Tax=Oxyplasma meridianum TaxID=3073602 RepID=A0AAX4NES7_9ARCH
MSWVPLRSAEKSAYSLCMKMAENHSLTIKSFKKDRSVEITRLPQSYRINEEGFEKQIYEITEDNLKHELKKIIEKEFPRSHQVMLTTRPRIL